MIMKKDPIVTETHEALRKRIRAFAEKEIKPVARELDEKEEFSEELTRKMGKEGLFGINVPEAYGGSGLDTLSYIIAVEELARIDSSQAATVASVNSLGLHPINKYGTEEQKQKYMPSICSGQKTWAFGLTEKNAGSDSQGTETEAILENGQWVINGEKMFISNASADMSGGVTIQVITGKRSDGKKELSTIIVEKGTDGYIAERIKGKMMWRAADTGKLFFNNCKVPEKNLLGARGKGPHIMLETLDGGRLSIAAIGLGLAQGAYELSLKYSQERKQFGQPIAKFQAIYFKLADMAMKIELARNTLYRACWLKDNGFPYGKEAAMAKLYCGEMAREVADEAVQVHGAYGLFREYDVERFYRDQRLLQVGEGTSEILRLVISRHLFNE
jgi:short-chain 2-methylacyl-CoA dehydrogenase